MARTASKLTDAEKQARRTGDRDQLEQAARRLLTCEGWRDWIRVRAANGLARYTLIISSAVCH